MLTQLFFILRVVAFLLCFSLIPFVCSGTFFLFHFFSTFFSIQNKIKKRNEKLYEHEMCEYVLSLSLLLLWCGWYTLPSPYSNEPKKIYANERIDIIFFFVCCFGLNQIKKSQNRKSKEPKMKIEKWLKLRNQHKRDYRFGFWEKK